MDIIEKLLTGNLGYGVIVILAGFTYMLYITLIVPTIERLEKQVKQLTEDKEKKQGTIERLEEQVSKDHEIIAKQQDENLKLASSVKTNSDLLEELSSLEDFEKKIKECLDEMQQLRKISERELDDVKEELGKDTEVLGNLKHSVESLIRQGKDNQESWKKTLKDIEESLDSLMSSKNNRRDELSSQVSGIITSIGDLKHLIAAGRFSEVRPRQDDDYRPQDNFSQRLK